MKEYKRLTEKENHDGYVEENCGNCHYYEKDKCSNKDCYEVIKRRLCELEDKIENGTLIELPCKVGDMFYYANALTKEVENHKITAIEIGQEMRIRTICSRTKTYTYIGYFLPSYYGKTIFLTKAEAKEKLKELQNGQ